MIIRTSFDTTTSKIEKYCKLLTNCYPISVKKSINSCWNLKLDRKLGYTYNFN